MSLTRKPPKHLRAAGKKLWSDIAAEYGIDDAAGLHLLTTACEALDRMRAAQAAIKKHGECVEDRYGCLKLNPACGLEKELRAGMILALKAMNLDIEPLRDHAGRPGRATTLTHRSSDRCPLSEHESPDTWARAFRSCSPGLFQGRLRRGYVRDERTPLAVLAARLRPRRAARVGDARRAARELATGAGATARARGSLQTPWAAVAGTGIR